MISKRLVGAIDIQINREIYSAYLYLSMAAYFDSLKLKGCANWMKVQFQEEMMHAMKLYDYVYLRGDRITLLPVEAPRASWGSPLKAFEHTLDHEKKVTSLINGLVSVAREEADEDAVKFLGWFVKEQKEEEESAEDKVEKFKNAGADETKVRKIDEELLKRTFHG